MRGLLALVCGTVLMSGAAAADRTASADGFRLRYDDAVWAQQAATPPSVLTLACIAPSCAPSTMVTFVRDQRTLPAPGFGAFGPGAAVGAMLDLRIQSLTPGSRVLARHPADPITIGGTSGYRGIYDIEDRALTRTGAVVMLLRLRDGTVEARMKLERLRPGEVSFFDGLLAGFELQN